LDRWNCILSDPIDLSTWQGDPDSDSESSESSESEVEENDEDESRKRKAAALKKKIEAARKQRDDSINVSPEPLESLRDFYTRTVGYWMNRMLNDDDDDVYIPDSMMGDSDVKASKRNAFSMAKHCYASWQTKLKELEKTVDEDEMMLQ
jgi:hypothetical protein